MNVPHYHFKDLFTFVFNGIICSILDRSCSRYNRLQTFSPFWSESLQRVEDLLQCETGIAFSYYLFAVTITPHEDFYICRILHFSTDFCFNLTNISSRFALHLFPPLPFINHNFCSASCSVLTLPEKSG